MPSIACYHRFIYYIILIQLCHNAHSVVMPPKSVSFGSDASLSDATNKAHIFLYQNGSSSDIPQPEITILQESLEMKINSISSVTINLNRAIDVDLIVKVSIRSKPGVLTFADTNNTLSNYQLQHALDPEPTVNKTPSVFKDQDDAGPTIEVKYPANNFGDKRIKLKSSDKAGHAIVACDIKDEATKKKYDISTSEAFTSINIGKSDRIKLLINIVGWIYFGAWSISFYFQVILNYQRKSVVGLNFDFLALNFFGFICYSIYNFTFMFSQEVKNEYYERNKYSRIPVEYNDLFFALHAVVLTTITIIQCFIYERGTQKVSIYASIFVGVAAVFGVALYVVSLFNKVTTLDVVIFLSDIKLAVTLIKYTPQAYMNYRRKATTGWSIHNILLDFTGGALSIGQMLLISVNYDDWISIFGNFTKFGLGVISIAFDILFLVQHYILYRGDSDYRLENSSESSVPEPVISQSIRSINQQPPPQEQQQQQEPKSSEGNTTEIET